MKYRLRIPLVIACLALLNLIALGRAIEAPFLWDDEALILENPFLGRAVGLSRYLSLSYWKRSPFPHDYRPFEMYSYSFDYLFWQKNPLGYHTTNILLHTFNCVALYLLLCMIFGKPKLAALAGALFALHPMHSEAVIWAQNRSELLAAGLSLVTIIAFIRSADRRPVGGLWSALAFIFFGLAFLTKENALAVPLLIAALLIVPGFLQGKRALRRLAPLLILAAALFLLKLFLLKQGRFDQARPFLWGGWLSHFFTVTTTMAIYLSMLVFPVNFSLDRFFQIPDARLAPAPLLYSAVVILVVVLAARESWRRRPEGLALSLLLIGLLPVCNIVFISGRPISEQRVYIASMGFCLLIALLIETRLRGRFPRPLIALLVLSIFTSYLLITIKRADCWRDEQVLWERTLERSPASYRPQIFLSRLYRKKGRFDESLTLLKSVIRAISPRTPLVFVDMGLTYKAMGWDECARREFERAVAVDPRYYDARVQLGDAYMRAARFEEARRQYLFVERTWPWKGKGQLGLGMLYREKGRHGDALKKFDEYLALFPDSPLALLNVASVHAAEGGQSEAEGIFKRVIEQNPRSAMARNDFGLFLERRGRLDEATAHYEQAVALAPREWRPHYNLAIAYRDAGEKGTALVEMIRAAQLNPARSDLLQEINILSAAVKAERPPEALLNTIFREWCELLKRRGVYSSRIGEESVAVQCFTKLISLQPDDGEAHANLGRIYAARGDYEDAVREILAASRLMPPAAPLYSSLGSCYAALGRFDEARAAWRKALEIEPQAKEPRRNLSRLRSIE